MGMRDQPLINAGVSWLTVEQNMFLSVKASLAVCIPISDGKRVLSPG